jgi:hypothetical protein
MGFAVTAAVIVEAVGEPCKRRKIINLAAVVT